jgi:hypothetical protein
VRWDRSQPFRAQSLKVTRSSYHEDDGLLQESRQEVMACAQLRAEFPGRVHGGVDLAAESRLSAGERRDDFAERRAADHEVSTVT